MCGIMGFVRTAKATDLRAAAVKETMKGIEERGNHAAGYGALYKVKGDDYVAAVRAPGTATALVETDKNIESRSRAASLFVGHARFATHGDPKINENNHPHYTEDMRYVMVHNGIIPDEVKGITCTSECDSEKALRLVEKLGAVEGFKALAALPMADYAIMVIDSADGCMYLCRNSRPIVYADCTESLGCVMIASTGDILTRALMRAGVVPSKVHSLEERVLYRWRPGDHKPRKVRTFAKPEGRVWKYQTARDLRRPMAPRLTEGTHYRLIDDDGSIIETDKVEEHPGDAAARYRRWLFSNSGRTN